MLSQIPRNPNFKPGVLAPNNYKAQILILGCMDATREKKSNFLFTRFQIHSVCVLRGRLCLLSLEFFPMKESAGG